jgi:hypothetical protein
MAKSKPATPAIPPPALDTEAPATEATLESTEPSDEMAGAPPPAEPPPADDAALDAPEASLEPSESAPPTMPQDAPPSDEAPKGDEPGESAPSPDAAPAAETSCHHDPKIQVRVWPYGFVLWNKRTFQPGELAGICPCDGTEEQAEEIVKVGAFAVVEPPPLDPKAD